MEAEGEMSIFETEEKRGGGKDHIGREIHGSRGRDEYL
jgi:hypothetical protein